MNIINHSCTIVRREQEYKKRNPADYESDWRG
jgi:hypothetical protein